MAKAEIIKTGSSDLVNITEVPEFLRQQQGNRAGMEDVEQSDSLMPRLGLCQALSPQRRKSDPSYIEGLQEGQFFNTVTQEIYGEELEVIALFFFKNRIKFNPIDEGGGIDCSSPNGINMGRYHPDGCILCEFSRWGNGESSTGESANDAPLCTMYHNFLAFSVSDRSPLAVSFKSTGLKVSKQFNATVRMSNLPMYAKRYKISSMIMRSGSNEWFEKRFTPIGFVDAEQFNQMEALFKALRDKDINVDTRGEGTGTEFPGGTAF